MPKLHCLTGLPASGKTTEALRMMADALKEGKVITRVSKDDIRAQLESTGWTWSHAKEREVIAAEDLLIIEALQRGEDVIVDDTNFGVKHHTRLEAIAKGQGAEIEWHDLTDVSVSMCVARDALREGKKRVGPNVIEGMAKAAGLLERDKPQPPRPYTAADRMDDLTGRELMPAIICDLDGTLADLNGRNPYDATLCMNDKLVRPVATLIGLFYRNSNYAIIYMSGREDKYRSQTQEFLRRHFCPQGPLHMRETGDYRKDYIVKHELFEKHVRGKYNVVAVIDDRPQVLRLWRSMGLFTFAVGDLNEF